MLVEQTALKKSDLDEFVMIEGHVGLSNQSILDIFLADQDNGFQFVPEGAQVVFLFSGQHDIGVSDDFEIMQPGPYITTYGGQQTTIALISGCSWAGGAKIRKMDVLFFSYVIDIHTLAVA